jgi:hypothetical protein
MKFSFLIVKLICVFIGICSVTSCRVTSITIAGGDVTNGELDLRNSKGEPATTIVVDPGQTVKWKIDKNSNVSSIEAIFEKEGNPNLFRKRAHKKKLSMTWKGKIEHLDALKEKGYTQEEYYIKWNNKTGVFIYDPFIQINPSMMQN